MWRLWQKSSRINAATPSLPPTGLLLPTLLCRRFQKKPVQRDVIAIRSREAAFITPPARVPKEPSPRAPAARPTATRALRLLSSSRCLLLRALSCRVAAPPHDFIRNVQRDSVNETSSSHFERSVFAPLSENCASSFFSPAFNFKDVLFQSTPTQSSPLCQMVPETVHMRPHPGLKTLTYVRALAVQSRQQELNS